MTALQDAASLATPSAQLVQPVDEIAGAYLIRPHARRDAHGFVSHALQSHWLHDVGVDPGRFVQDSMMRTRHRVVRGLHLRRGPGEGTLVRCLRGVIASVVVDLRPHSPTFRNLFMVELKTDPPMTLYVPPGCARGFQALTEPADVNYRIDREPDPSEELVIPWDDPDLDVPWPLRPEGAIASDVATTSLASVLEVPG